MPTCVVRALHVEIQGYKDVYLPELQGYKDIYSPEVQGYKDIYSPVTLTCTQECVLVTFRSYGAIANINKSLQS